MMPAEEQSSVSTCLSFTCCTPRNAMTCELALAILRCRLHLRGRRAATRACSPGGISVKQ